MIMVSRKRREKSPTQIDRVNALSLREFIEAHLPLPMWFQHPKSLKAYSITVTSPSSLSNEDFASCFDLIATTSGSAYASSSFGWHPKAKRKEMRLPDLRYLLVRSTVTPSSLVEAFLSFMFTFEDGYEVLYVYEIHVSEELRGLGLGKKLMGIVEDVGRKVGVEKEMLTVFAANTAAVRFYKNLGWDVDVFSPEPRVLRNGLVKESDYVILSKDIKYGQT